MVCEASLVCKELGAVVAWNTTWFECSGHAGERNPINRELGDLTKTEMASVRKLLRRKQQTMLTTALFLMSTSPLF